MDEKTGLVGLKKIGKQKKLNQLKVALDLKKCSLTTKTEKEVLICRCFVNCLNTSMFL